MDKRRESSQTRRIRRTKVDWFGIIMMFVLLVCSLAIFARLMATKMLTTTNMVLIMVALLVVNGLHIFVQLPLRRNKLGKLICGALAVLLSAGMIYGTVAAGAVQSALNKISGVMVEKQVTAVIVMKEAIAGLLIGFGANICMAIVNFAGSIADMETGLSMATLMDPATRESTSITGALYQYSFMLMLIASGMYRYLFGALADSFTLIPINGVTFHADSLLNSMIEFMNDYILIGFRIVLPIFCVTLLLNAILGVLAKVSPQMNMFAVGIQLKVLAGLSALFLTAGMLPGAADFVYQEMKKMVVSFIGGMM